MCWHKSPGFCDLFGTQRVTHFSGGTADSTSSACTMTVRCNATGAMTRTGWSGTQERNFGSHFKTPPVMIEGQFEAQSETLQGNYELCVAVHGPTLTVYRKLNNTNCPVGAAAF